MSDLITKLLQGKTVEWKTLGEIAEITIGEFVHKNNQNLFAKYPVYNGGVTPTGYYEKYNNLGKKIIISARGANAGFVNKAVVPYWAGNSCYSIKVKNVQKVNWLFLYYFFKNFESKLSKIQQKGGIPAISKKQIIDIKIPIPPLSVQAEIVRILDSFTALTAELTAELSMRKKQYNYYRDTLLTFKDGQAEWKTLGEVTSKISSGGTPLSTREDYYNGDIPWLRTQEVRFMDILKTEVKITEKGLINSSAKWIPSNCVIIAISGATAGRSAINKIALTTNQHCCNLEIDPKYVNYKYVFHWVSKEYDALKALGQGARSDLNSGIIRDFKIPVPPLAEQERIVAILDQFDTITNSITEGLPREIALRQQQYEYYREQLLNFPK